MVQAKCIKKIRDRTGRITGYVLVDVNNKTLSMSSTELKELIKEHKINVINLRLTNDNRLIDRSGKEMVTSNDAAINQTSQVARELQTSQVARALAELYIIYGIGVKQLARHTALGLCTDADIDFDPNADYVMQATLAFQKLISNQKYIEEILLALCGRSDIYKNIAIKDETEINTSLASKILEDLKLLNSYSLKYTLNTEIHTGFESIIKHLKYEFNYGYLIGKRYYKYLNVNYFGISLDDKFTVGYTLDDAPKEIISNIPEDEIYNYNCYYILHKRINLPGAPRTPFELLFGKYHGLDAVTIYLARETCLSDGTLGIIPGLYELGAVILDKESLDENVKKLAGALTSLVPRVYLIANSNLSLYEPKAISAPLEKINELSINTNKSHPEVMSILLNRLTAITGKRLPAVVECTSDSYDGTKNLFCSNGEWNKTIHISVKNRIGNTKDQNYRLEVRIVPPIHEISLQLKDKNTKEIINECSVEYSNTDFYIGAAHVIANMRLIIRNL